MRKKLFAAFVVAVGVAFAGYNMVQSQNEKNVLSVLALANVEALANGEQPNVNDCKEDPDSACEALHPTDPSKDQYRPKAKW